MLCAPHGNNVGAVVHPHHLPLPSHLIPPLLPLLLFGYRHQISDHKSLGFRLFCLSGKEFLLHSSVWVYVCVGARAYVVGVRVCVRAINLSLVIIVLIVSLAFGFNVRSAFMYCICCPAPLPPLIIAVIATVGWEIDGNLLMVFFPSLPFFFGFTGQPAGQSEPLLASHLSN